MTAGALKFWAEAHSNTIGFDTGSDKKKPELPKKMSRTKKADQTLLLTDRDDGYRIMFMKDDIRVVREGEHFCSVQLKSDSKVYEVRESLDKIRYEIKNNNGV